MASIGVDFGGTQIKIARVEGSRVVAEHAVDTPRAEGPTAVLEALARGVLAIDSHPEAVGLAIPGQVDAGGICYRLPNVAGFENINIAGILRPLLGCSVAVENDANAAAHAEARFGAGRQYPSFAMLTLGTGVGGGIVIDGRVRTGAYGFAAELGHICVDTSPDAAPCACGARGCVESYASTRALLRVFREAGGTAEEVLPIAESARRGERAGVAAFEMMAKALARGITTLQTLLDLDAIVFTGGISRSFALLEPTLRAEVEQHAFSKPLGQIPLVVSELGTQAGVVGAANLHLLEQPT